MYKCTVYILGIVSAYYTALNQVQLYCIYSRNSICLLYCIKPSTTILYIF